MGKKDVELLRAQGEGKLAGEDALGAANTRRTIGGPLVLVFGWPKCQSQWEFAERAASEGGFAGTSLLLKSVRLLDG